jgi:hypothetical protein
MHHGGRRVAGSLAFLPFTIFVVGTSIFAASNLGRFFKSAAHSHSLKMLTLTLSDMCDT